MLNRMTFIGILIISLVPLSGSTALGEYSIPASVMDSGGGAAASTHYALVGSLGQPISPATGTSTGFKNQAGFIPSLYGSILYTLLVKFDPTGTGSGSVTVTPPGTLVCNTDCQAKIAGLTPVQLTSDPAQSSVFGGWSGAGCGSAADCTFTMNGDTTVTAQFLDSSHKAYNPGTGVYYSSLQAAYDAALDGATIKVWDVEYTENLSCGQDKSVTIKGGYDEGYTANSGYTTLKGILTIGRGTVVTERIIVW